MKKNWFVVLASIIFVLLITGLFFDKAIANFMLENQSKPLVMLSIIISTIGIWYAVFIFMNALLYFSKKSHALWQFWLTFVISLSITYALKFLLYRARPIIETGVFASSFPSGHAAAVFSAVAILWKNFQRIRYVWIAFAFLVLLSRIYLGAHYMSDVAAGALISLFVGLIVESYLQKN